MSESLDFLVIPIPIPLLVIPIPIPIPPSHILVIPIPIPIPLKISNAIFRLYNVFIWHIKAFVYTNHAYEW